VAQLDGAQLGRVDRGVAICAVRLLVAQLDGAQLGRGSRRL
jgi:hypothetical protein